jgi:hypothetical protein
MTVLRMKRHLGGLALSGAVAVGCVAALAPTAPAAARSAAAAAPPSSTPLTITYAGRFELTNTLVPQASPSSYTYHVEWAYTWSGTWGTLFPSGARLSSDRTAFSGIAVSGTAEVTYRDRNDGPDKTCRLAVTANPTSPAGFLARYDPADETIVVSVEAPTFAGSRIEQGPDPGCVGGPGVNLFSAPPDFRPLGDGGAAFDWSRPGTHPFDGDWRWTHRFASGRRDFTASIRTRLSVGSSSCTPNRAPSTRAAKSPTPAEPCIEIVHKGKPLANGAAVRVVVGEPVRLTVRLKDSKEQVKAPIEWTVEGSSDDLATTSTLGGYRVTATSAAATHLSKAARKSTSIAFHLIRKGTFEVSVRTGSGVASASFATDFPSIHPTVATCDVRLNTTLTIQGQPPPWLGPGWNDACPYAEPLGGASRASSGRSGWTGRGEPSG